MGSTSQLLPVTAGPQEEHSNSGVERAQVAHGPGASDSGPQD